MANEEWPAAGAADNTAPADKAANTDRTNRGEAAAKADNAGKPDKTFEAETAAGGDNTGKQNTSGAPDSAGKPDKTPENPSGNPAGNPSVTRSRSRRRAGRSSRPAVASRRDAVARTDASDRSETSARSDASGRAAPARSENSGRAETPARTAASGRPETASRQSKKGSPRIAKPLPPLDRTFHPLERTVRQPEKTSGRSEKTARRAEKAGNPTAGKPSLGWTWRDYALQLSVVIIGIVVTFVGSNLIAHWARQRQVKTVMQLVAGELEENREQLREVCASLVYDQQGMLMLMDYDMDIEAVPLDSLENYRYILSRLHAYSPLQNVLEVLKSSDVVSAVGDKQLLVDIFGCYNRLNDFREQVLLYSDRKREAQNHLFTNNTGFSVGGGDQRRSWRGIMADPMCAAFLGTSAYFFGANNNFSEKIAAVDLTIDRIKDKYGFE